MLGHPLEEYQSSESTLVFIYILSLVFILQVTFTEPLSCWDANTTLYVN